MASLERQTQFFMDDGAVAAVVQIRWPGGEWSKSWGVRDLATRAPARSSDLVEVASITKTMTAVTVLKLVDDGLVGLDDPVNGIVPAFQTAHPPGPITVRQLLSHTSGAPEFNEALYPEVDFRGVNGQVTAERALQLAGTLPWRQFAVGSFRYSNTNYMALGLLVEALRHKPYAQVLREEVIDPLGLKDTTTQRLDLNHPALVHGYVMLRGERIDVTDNTVAIDSPAYGAVSTVADMNTFFGALFQGKLVSAKSLAEMEKPPSLAPYALGLWTRTTDGCTGEMRFEGRGGFWAYTTIAVSSKDGKYTAAMTLVPPALPTELEDSSTEAKRELYGGQIESALNETLDRLCQH